MFSKTFEVVIKVLGTRYAYTFHYESESPKTDEQIAKLFMDNVLPKEQKKLYNLKTNGKFKLESLRPLK